LSFRQIRAFALEPLKHSQLIPLTKSDKPQWRTQLKEHSYHSSLGHQTCRSLLELPSGANLQVLCLQQVEHIAFARKTQKYKLLELLTLSIKAKLSPYGLVEVKFPEKEVSQHNPSVFYSSYPSVYDSLFPYQKSGVNNATVSK